MLNYIQQVYEYNETDCFHQKEHLELFASQMRDKQYCEDCFETTTSDWLWYHGSIAVPITLSVIAKVIKNITLHTSFPSSLKTLLFCRLDFRINICLSSRFPYDGCDTVYKLPLPLNISNFPISLTYFLSFVLGN